MAESPRTPHTDVWRPGAAVHNARAAAARLQAGHTDTVAKAQAAVAGVKLSAADKQDAADLLTSLAGLLAGDGPVHESLGYLLTSATDAIRLRRAAAEAAAV